MKLAKPKTLTIVEDLLCTKDWLEMPRGQARPKLSHQVEPRRVSNPNSKVDAAQCQQLLAQCRPLLPQFSKQPRIKTEPHLRPTPSQCKNTRICFYSCRDIDNNKDLINSKGVGVSSECARLNAGRPVRVGVDTAEPALTRPAQPEKCRLEMRVCERWLICFGKDINTYICTTPIKDT